MTPHVDNPPPAIDENESAITSTVAVPWRPFQDALIVVESPTTPALTRPALSTTATVGFEVTQLT